MAWYDAGTVTVTLNSATVTGVGTQWVAGARQGEAFVGPDGRLYEVLNIASNTSLTLTRPYRGATQAAQPYALAPFQGYVKELADRAAELLRRYSDALVLAEGAVQRTSIGSKYAADTNQILPGFAYGLGGRPDAFPPVSADDITAPPGIYYVLDVRHTGFPKPYGILVRSGGRVEGDSWLFDRFYSADSDSYERKSINGGAWTPWDPMLHKANAAFHLGLKSGAFADIIGDVGAGAIMQSGVSANGSWVKFADGTMRTRRQLAINMAGATWTGSTPGYCAVFGTIQFPAAFLAGTEPVVTIGVRDSFVAGRSAYLASYALSNSSISGIYLASPNSAAAAGGTVTLDISAEGYWK